LFGQRRTSEIWGKPLALACPKCRRLVMRLCLLVALAVGGCTSPSFTTAADASSPTLQTDASDESHAPDASHAVDASKEPEAREPGDASTSQDAGPDNLPPGNKEPCMVNVSKIGECTL
jgi:hypothetical protein